MKILVQWWVGLLMSVWAVSSAAASDIDTLQRLSETGSLRVGYGDTAPFSYTDDNGNVLGYSIELCQQVASQLQEQLGLPSLAIEYVFRTPGNRVQMLNSGEIDIECTQSPIMKSADAALIFR